MKFFGFLLFFYSVFSLKFELHGLPKEHSSNANQLCLSQFIGKDYLVNGNATLSTIQSQMTVKITVTDEQENIYFTKNNVKSDCQFSFKSHSHATIKFCFTAELEAGVAPSPAYSTFITFQLDTGNK